MKYGVDFHKFYSTFTVYPSSQPPEITVWAARADCGSSCRVGAGISRIPVSLSKAAMACEREDGNLSISSCELDPGLVVNGGHSFIL